MRSLLQGMEMVFCSMLPLPSEIPFLYYSLKIACDTVPMSFLSEDVDPIEQYPLLEIHTQILLPLLCCWRGDHCCFKVSSNEE